MNQSLQGNPLIKKLSEINDYCSNIEKLLSSDIQNFKDNNVRDVLLNSENEILEIQKITGAIETIKSIYSISDNNDLASIIRSHTRVFDKQMNQELKEILRGIGEKAQNCQNLITSNNQIIFHNAMQLKSLFTAITQSQAGLNQLYNENGKLNSDVK